MEALNPNFKKASHPSHTLRSQVLSLIPNIHTDILYLDYVTSILLGSGNTKVFRKMYTSVSPSQEVSSVRAGVLSALFTIEFPVSGI